MDQDKFLDAAQRRTQVDSRDAAYTISHASLSVLGQRISRSDAESVASQLPKTLADALTFENETAEEFSADEFAERVHRQEIEEEHFSVPPTNRHVRAVMEVVGTATTGNALEDMCNQLPNDFESLFEPVGTERLHSTESAD